MAVVFENCSRLKSIGALGVSVHRPVVCEPRSRTSLSATSSARRLQALSPLAGAEECHVGLSTRQTLASASESWNHAIGRGPSIFWCGRRSESPEAGFDSESSFRGIVFCADCPGVDVVEHYCAGEDTCAGRGVRSGSIPPPGSPETVKTSASKPTTRLAAANPVEALSFWARERLATMSHAPPPAPTRTLRRGTKAKRTKEERKQQTDTVRRELFVSCANFNSFQSNQSDRCQ